MKSFKRILRAALALLVMLSLMIPMALASSGTESEPPAATDPPAETSSPEPMKCSLTLSFTPGDKAASGVVFTLYRVADVFPEQVKFQALEGFNYHVLEGTGTWAEKAGTLKGYVERDKKEPTATGTTDAEGKVSFTDLDKGIYLVVGTKTGDMSGKQYTPAPCLLTLPAFSPEANAWVTKDLTANVKSYSSEDVGGGGGNNSPKYLEVIVKWEDNDNEAGERPDYVVVELYRKTTGKVIHTVEVKAGQDWSYRWKKPWDDLEARIKGGSEMGYRDDLISRNYEGAEDVVTKYSDKGDTRTWVLTLKLGDIDLPDDKPPTTDLEGNGEVRVLKVWEDGDDAEGVRPSSVTVDLVGKDGEVKNTVVLSSENNWGYTWSGLDESVQWQVVEREQDNYTVNVTVTPSGENRKTHVITNTYSTDITDDGPPLIDLPDGQDPSNPDDPFYPGDPDVPKDPGFPADPANPVSTPAPGEDIPDGDVPLEMLPQTGVLWWPVPIMALLGAALILLGYARRRAAR